MPRRRCLALLCALAVVSLAACGGGGSGYGCTGRTCTASFRGPGEQDLSSNLGSGATFSVETIDGQSTTVRIAGQDAKLVKGEMQRVEGYEVTLTEVDGEFVTFRIVGD